MSFHLMGVINLTPNSFSDPSKHFVPHAIGQTLDHFKTYGVEILDIGAESTAPMNEEVGEKEEWARLEEHFFGHPKWRQFFEFDLSLDSFRPQNVRRFFARLRELGFKRRCFWNDVAGVLDEEVFELCRELALTYIYCHNEIATRKEVFCHSKTFGEGPIVERVKRDLLEVSELFEREKVRLIFDPCFGFSKRREENYEILQALPELSRHRSGAFMIGISRKSFLRALTPWAQGPAEKNAVSDQLQALYFGQLLKEERAGNLKGEFYLRLHEPLSFELARQAQTFLK